MSFLITELELLGPSISVKLAKEIVQESTKELYRYKKHTRNCRRIHLEESYFACAMDEYIKNEKFDKTRKCRFEIHCLEDLDASLPSLDGSP